MNTRVPLPTPKPLLCPNQPTVLLSFGPGKKAINIHNEFSIVNNKIKIFYCPGMRQEKWAYVSIHTVIQNII